MKIYEGKGYDPPKTVLNDQIVRLSVSEGITREQAVLQLWQREKPLTTEEYEHARASMTETVILEDKDAKLTTETLVIKGETFKVSEIEKAWANTGFFRKSLMIRLNNGKEKEFKRFFKVPTSVGLASTFGDPGSGIVYICSRLDIWANNINTQVANHKQNEGKSKTIIALKCSSCGAKLDASLKCPYCGVQYKTS